MSRKDEIYSGIEQLELFKTKRDKINSEYALLLDKITQKEQSLQEKYKNLKGKSITDDLVKNNTLQELNDILEKKDKTREKILELQDYISDFTLKVDEILFDNIVLLNTIHTNIDNLKKLFQS